MEHLPWLLPVWILLIFEQMQSYKRFISNKYYSSVFSRLQAKGQIIGTQVNPLIVYILFMCIHTACKSIVAQIILDYPGT